MIAVVMVQRVNALRVGECYELPDGFANALIAYKRAIPFDDQPEAAAVDHQAERSVVPATGRKRRG